MIAVDTSVWIAFFRATDRALVAHLENILDADEVMLVAPVRVELLAGASRRDFQTLDRVLSALPVVHPKQETWQRIDRWIASAVAASQRFGFADLLIASLAVDERAPIWSLDRDFRRMTRLGFIAVHRE